jgi:hypothetical protein
MTSITQKIPSYTGGISQQPDELKTPGQLRTAKNVLPDIAHGLIKRPGGRLIGGNLGAYTTDSKWFHYYRDEAEQYIGQIQLSTGEIKMWRCNTGAAVTVNYESGQATALKNYLKQTNSGGTITDGDIQTLTLNDYTYITNRNKATAMSSTVETVRPYEAYIELKKVQYASQYAVNLFNNTTTQTVTTATRISIKRLVDSSNSCSSNGDSLPSSGTLPGTSGYTSNCDKGAGANGDSYCPNVDTKVFNVTDGAALDTDETNGASVTYNVKDSSNNSVNRGVDLYFRVTTTGQAVPESQETSPEYRCRYTTIVDMLYGGSGWQVGDHFELWMRNAKYQIMINEVSTALVQANLGLIRPTPTPFDNKTTVTAESILGDLQTDILATSEFSSGEVQIIGSGVYLTNGTSFNVTSPTGDLLNVITTECNDVSDLPTQCKNGYVAKIKNSEANEDDYYVQFFGENGRDGPGTWEECAKPGRKITIDPATMPIQLIREANGTFTVKQVVWENCVVGDEITASEPSFIGKQINKMLFFRNRMVFLSDENVIMSQPGEFFNFWPRSAITYSATDVIDLSCSSEYPAIVYDGIQVNAGLLLFTKNKQFMLTTDSDVLSPQTAKLNSLASYNFNSNTSPISLGTTVAWLDNAGKYARFFEMNSIFREGEPNVLEQSKVISKAFPNDINLIANSRENSTIFFATKGASKIYGFRYYSVGTQRIQQAWFEWEFDGEIQHLAMLDDAIYFIIKNGTTYTMQKFSIRLDDNSHTIVEDATYRVHLDNAKKFAYTALTYVEDGDYTKFDHTAADFNASGQLYAVAVSTGSDEEFNGLISKVTTFDDQSTTKIKIPGNWKTTDASKAFDLILGYSFDMEIEFPTIYVLQGDGTKTRADLQSSLVVHRTKLSLGPAGVYDTLLKRIGKPDYTETFESIAADSYLANNVGIDKEQVVTLPIYEKNTNLTLSLKSTHPSPATLYSMDWEGDYSNRYYQRV